ncbi:MAG: calcium-binding protein [Methylococcales bacterium]|nr:calcium-binding protein [Methylococcales bacterium]
MIKTINSSSKIKLITDKTNPDWVYSIVNTSPETLTQSAGDIINIGFGTVATIIDYSKSSFDNDFLTLGSSITTINGGSGSDFITGSNNASKLTGNAGSDDIIGGIGNDTINGGDGDDNIAGGLGNNSLTGGNGADFFVVIANDIITDLGLGADDLSVASTASANATLLANFKSTVRTLNNGEAIIVDKGSFNVDLSSATGDQGFTINADKSLNSVSLIGSNKVDTIIAGSGNDTLDGGFGADSFTGGKGNNVFMVDNKNDVVLDKEGGVDTVISSVNFALGATIENITLTGTANLFAKGNKLNNVITANDGNDFLIAGSGNVTIRGGIGDDVIYGSLGKASKSVIDGGAGDDEITAGLGANILSGGAGGDTFIYAKGTGSTKIIDFQPGVDHLEIRLGAFKGLHLGVLDNSNFSSGISTVAPNTHTQFIYNTKDGKLYYDQDGSYANSQPILIETLGLTSHPVLLASDISIID